MSGVIEDLGDVTELVIEVDPEAFYMRAVIEELDPEAKITFLSMTAVVEELEAGGMLG